MTTSQPWVVITGATGDIGQALVSAFHSNGYRIIATDVVLPVEDLSCDHFIQADLSQSVSDEAYAEELFQRIRQLLPEGKLKALVNNAAVQILAPSEKLTRKDWLKTLEVNLMAPFFWSQAFLPELESGTGSIVNISSIHANLTKAEFVAYATSKAALSAMTRNMAVDIGASVRINAIEPAAVATRMLEEGFAESPSGLEKLASLHPIGRIGAVSEIANAALFLCSKDAGFIHGTCMSVSGGIHNCLLDPV